MIEPRFTAYRKLFEPCVGTAPAICSSFGSTSGDVGEGGAGADSWIDAEAEGEADGEDTEGDGANPEGAGDSDGSEGVGEEAGMGEATDTGEDDGDAAPD
jgi:hypothetical protein